MYVVVGGLALSKASGGSDAVLAVRLILPTTKCEGDDATLERRWGGGVEGRATE